MSDFEGMADAGDCDPCGTPDVDTNQSQDLSSPTVLRVDGTLRRSRMSAVLWLLITVTVMLLGLFALSWRSRLSQQPRIPVGGQAQEPPRTLTIRRAHTQHVGRSRGRRTALAPTRPRRSREVLAPQHVGGPGSCDDSCDAHTTPPLNDKRTYRRSRQPLAPKQANSKATEGQSEGEFGFED